MKKGTIALAALAVVAAVVALTGCGGGSGGANPRLLGRVADTSGVPVAGVTVSLESNPSVTAVTNADGAYVLRGVPVGGNFMVRYRKAGFADSHGIGLVADGKYSTLDVVLFRQGRAVSIPTDTDQVVADSRADGRNARVTFQAGSIVDAAGAPVSTADISITTALPSDPNFNSAYPSSFVGIAGGLHVPLISYGAVHVALKDAAGQALRLDATKPATIELPVDPSNDPMAPQVPLWSLDETTGKWVQEGLATRDASASPVVYRAQVTHFSWWAINIFPSSNHIVVVHCVEDPTVNPLVPVPGAYVTIRKDRGTWQARAITSSQGLAAFIVPPPGPYWVEAKKAYHEDKGVYSVVTEIDTTTVVYWLRPFSTGAAGGN